MKHSFMDALGISLEDEEAPSIVREVKVDRKVEDLKQAHIGIMCNQYAALLDLLSSLRGPEKEDEKRVEKIKFLEKVEADLPMLFTMIRMAVGKEHFQSYKEDENAKKRFIKNVRDYFANNPSPSDCRKELSNLMRRIPLPVKQEEQRAEREQMTPLAALRKPISNPALAQPTSRLAGPSRLPPPSRMQQPTSRLQGPSRQQQPSRMLQPTQRQPQLTLRPPSAPARTQRSPSPARQVLARPTTPRSAESPRPTNVQRTLARSASPRRPQSTPSRLNKSMTSTPIQEQGRVRQPQHEARSPVQKIHEKVTHGLKQLQVMKSREKNANSIKQKLSLLTKRFCASKFPQ